MLGPPESSSLEEDRSVDELSDTRWIFLLRRCPEASGGAVGDCRRGPKLVGLILGGKLPSFSSDARGNLHEISPEAWQNIDTVRVLQEQEFRNFRDFPSGLSKGRPVFIESDLRRELPFDWEIREAEKSGSDLSVKKGGPPLKYDWDAMWIEVVRISEHDVSRKPGLNW